MSEVETTIRHIEFKLAEAKKAKGLLDSLTRLEANKDYQKIVIDFWSVKEAASFAAASVMPIPEANRLDAVAMAQAPGYYARWIQGQKNILNTLIASVEGFESDLAALNSQQAEDDQAADEDASPADLVV